VTHRQISITPAKGWFPLILITLLTIAIFIVSIISLLSGWLTIFQNLFYFPIILACVYYQKRGFVFSVLLACSYFILMVIFSNDPVGLQGAFVRVLIFILVAGVITYLSIIRIRAEEAVQESEIKFHTLADFTVDWEYWLAPDNNFVYISPSCHVITGYSQEEFTADPTLLTKIVYPDDTPLYSDHFTRIHGSVKEGNLDFRIMRKDGEIRWIAHSCKPVYDRDGTYLGRRVSNRDITERKLVEVALHHANKKLTLLSSITRHDINNQLTVLQGYLTLIEQKQSDPVLNNYLQKAATAAERISAMIQFTKEYDKIGIHAPIWQDCRTLLTTAAKQAPLGHVELKTDFPSGTEVFADPLIVKVCYNLMDNAVRYGKKITTIRFSVENYNGDHVVVCEDDGVGVPAEEKEKIFIRGFGKNTGLGLFLSREILGITGITIRENGEPGKGARFEMTVPKGAWRMTGKGN
jgi:PAS domain S-box-containing protein